MYNLLAAQYGTVSDIEIVWTIIAIIGVVFSLHNMREGFKDRAAVRLLGSPKGPRALIAWATIRSEGARAIIQLFFVVAGVLSMLIEDPTNQLDLPTKQVVIGLVLRWGFVVSALLLTLKSYWVHQLREQVTRLPSFTDALDEADPDIDTSYNGRHSAVTEDDSDAE